MIHRKWSLLTGPVTILAGIVGTVVVADLLFIENVNRIQEVDDFLALRGDWLREMDRRKQEAATSTK